MNFASLSEAIQYYASSPDTLNNLAPYSDISVQITKIPQNINFVNPSPPNVIIFGQSIWGIGQIIDIGKPLL